MCVPSSILCSLHLAGTITLYAGTVPTRVLTRQTEEIFEDLEAENSQVRSLSRNKIPSSSGSAARRSLLPAA